MGSAIDPSSGIEFDSDGFVEVPITDLNSAIMPVLVMGPELLMCVGTAFNIVGDGILEPYQKLGPPPASLQVTHTVARVSDKAPCYSEACCAGSP